VPILYGWSWRGDDRGVIAYDQVTPLISEACPAYLASDEATAVDAEDGAYTHVVQVVIYVLRRLGEGDPAPLDAVMAAAETVLADGDEDARTLIELGLIEDLTNRNFWPEGLEPSGLLHHLGPRALRTRCGWQLRLDAQE
jgi:hypothetical protein